MSLRHCKYTTYTLEVTIKILAPAYISTTTLGLLYVKTAPKTHIQEKTYKYT